MTIEALERISNKGKLSKADLPKVIKQVTEESADKLETQEAQLKQMAARGIPAAVALELVIMQSRLDANAKLLKLMSSRLPKSRRN